MIEEIDLSACLAEQKELDLDIMAHHPGTGYTETFDRRCLALLVELGEFANETRCFKYWSLKGPSPKERVLDEGADALHFFLSLGLALGYKTLSIPFENDDNPCKTPLSNLFLEAYEEVSRFATSHSEEDYKKAFSTYLRIFPALGYGLKDLFEAYEKKRLVNFERQRASY